MMWLRGKPYAIRIWLQELFSNVRGEGTASRTEEPEEYSNPYIPFSRQAIEQILAAKGLDYRRFCPIVIDTDTPEQVFGERDDVDQALDQLEKGLNFLELCTDRPDYFAGWKEEMEEEYGLIVRILPKRGTDPLYGNMVLDFERHQPVWTEMFPREVIYLPFQKVRWEAAESCHEDAEQALAEKTVENPETCPKEYLDIKVPIGYNMLTVKVEKMTG